MKSSMAVKVAVGGVFSAIALVLMMLTGVFPFGTYAFPVIAGVMLIVIYLEFGFRWSMLVYGVISIMSVLFVSDKEAALFFLLLFGYYPVVKSFIERIKSKIVQYIIKLAIFNTAAVSVYFLMLFVFGMPADSFELFGVNIPLIFLIVGNFVFLIYDLAINVVVAQYLQKYRKFFFK
ncbi:MAG: hypothetical protein SO152_08080 [Ruminococcus sp.]|nr:hypothetical protein [Ruminococcus sp.]